MKKKILATKMFLLKYTFMKEKKSQDRYQISHVCRYRIVSDTNKLS